MKKLTGDLGIVTIRYSKILPEFVMILMEYCAGGSLEQYVKDRNGDVMDESIIKSICNQILSAMFNYFEKGLIHRDIKPENILIDEFTRIKISDFGLAVETNGKSRLPTRIDFAGTNRYLPPDFEDNGVSQSIKSDIWAFGVILLELAYGREAYKISKITALDGTKIRDEFQRRGGYSDEMAEFLSRCLERKSEDRATIEELLRHKWFYDVDLNRAIPVIKPGNNN